MTETFTIRRATPDDAVLLARHRYLMFEEMRRVQSEFIPWAQVKIAQGEYHGWLAVSAEGETAAGVGLWIYEWVPHPRGANNVRGHILNVYTEPAYQKRGLARQLMATLLEYCREHKIPRLTPGFRQETNWMSLRLE
jgi:GNAT superfamily N-acetyltransferase